MTYGSLVPVKHYTDADQMIADYRDRRRRMFPARSETINIPPSVIVGWQACSVIIDELCAPNEPPGTECFDTSPRDELSVWTAWNLVFLRKGYLPNAPSVGLIRYEPAMIIEIVCDLSDLSPIELLSKRRSQYVCKPRQIAQWLCLRFTPLSLLSIGKAFGGLDHTTVIHSRRAIEPIADCVTPSDDTPVAWCRSLLEKVKQK